MFNWQAEGPEFSGQYCKTQTQNKTPRRVEKTAELCPGVLDGVSPGAQAKSILGNWKLNQEDAISK